MTPTKYNGMPSAMMPRQQNDSNGKSMSVIRMMKAHMMKKLIG